MKAQCFNTQEKLARKLASFGLVVLLVGGLGSAANLTAQVPSPKPGGPPPEQSPMSAAADGLGCWCGASVYQGDSFGTFNNRVLDWGEIHSYNNPPTQNKEKDCQARCSAQAAQDSSFNNDNFWCAKAAKAGQTRVVAYAKIGTRDWQVVQTKYVNCCQTGGGITCPQGWLPDGNGPGPNKCKKMVCALQEAPLPPNNTLIGNWGFTWGNGIWMWGKATTIEPVQFSACR